MILINVKTVYLIPLPSACPVAGAFFMYDKFIPFLLPFQTVSIIMQLFLHIKKVAICIIIWYNIAKDAIGADIMITVDKIALVVSIVGQIVIPLFFSLCKKSRRTSGNIPESNQKNDYSQKHTFVNNGNVSNSAVGENAVLNNFGTVNQNCTTINNFANTPCNVKDTSTINETSNFVTIVFLALVISVPLFSKYHSAFLLIMSFLFSIFISIQNISFKIRRKYMVFIISCYLFSYFCFVHPLFIASSYSTFVDSSILYILKKPTLAKVRNYLGVLSQLLSTVMWCSYFASSIVCEIKRKPTPQSDRLSFNSDKISDKVILISILLLSSALMVPYLAIFCFDATF